MFYNIVGILYPYNINNHSVLQHRWHTAVPLLITIRIYLVQKCFTISLADFFLFYFYHFHSPAQLVGGFTLSDLLDKPWSQVSSLSPPRTCLQFLSRLGFSIPTACRFSSNVTNSRSRAFPLIIFFKQEKVPTNRCTR